MDGIRIILNKEQGTIDLLYNGYNIIAQTIYDYELTNKILELIENDLKNTYYNFTTLEELLKK